MISRLGVLRSILKVEKLVHPMEKLRQIESLTTSLLLGVSE